MSASTWIVVRENGKKRKVEIIRKFNVGLMPTHNKDGRYMLTWALGVDGKLYRTTPRANGYRPAREGELYPVELRVQAPR
jgi:hypothetical protein